MDLDKLGELQIFSGMDAKEVKAVVANMEKLSFRENDKIFLKDDEGGTMYIVTEGEVQINASIAPELKKSLLHVPAGGVFGELSLFAREERSAEAVSLTETHLLAIDTKSFQELLVEEPAAGAKFLTVLANIISDRLRTMTDMYCQALDWSLSVSGALELHLDHLISNNVNLNVQLINGESRLGRLLKIEEHATGHVVFLQSQDGELQLIPYHAIMSMSFDRVAIQQQSDKNLL